MSWSINIPVVSTLKLALGNAAHDQVLGNADLGGSKPIPIPGGQVSLGAALKASVELFNDPDDKDAHGIIGVAPKESDGSTVEPLYSPDGTACWLKYAAQLDAEATGQGPFPFVELSGGGTVQVLVTDYRQHTATQTLEAALGADAKSLRLPFLLGDVQALRPGDALSFQSALELKAGVKVSWSILSTSLASALAKRLAGRLVFDFNVEAGASIGGTVSLKDEFRLVFSRPTFDGPFRVSVRKATSDSAGTQVGVGVTLQYSSPLLAAILGAVDSRVQDALKLVEGLENNALTPVLLQVAGAVLKQLGFLKSSDLTLASIRAAYDELKAFVDSVVSGALKAAFTYEYVRSTEDSTLLELEVPADQLASAHGDFISGDLASIQGRVKNAWLKRYFHMKTVESERSWGLGLSWRDVNFATQEDRRKLKAVVQHASRDHRNGPRRYAFQGARSYSSAGLLYGGKTSSWGTDFSAQMPRYSLTPSADEFEFAFFAQRKVEDTLSKELIQSELDAATVWGILRPEDLVELVERFFRVAASGTQASSRLELRVDTDSFRKLLAKLGTEPVLERQAFARALARAMPRDSQPVRRNIDRREELLHAALGRLPEGRREGLDPGPGQGERGVSPEDPCRGGRRLRRAVGAERAHRHVLGRARAVVALRGRHRRQAVREGACLLEGPARQAQRAEQGHPERDRHPGERRDLRRAAGLRGPGRPGLRRLPRRRVHGLARPARQAVGPGGGHAAEPDHSSG